jgi:transposase
LIAEFCAAQHPQPWQAPSPAIRELRALVARRNALDAMRTQEKNRVLVARDAVRGGIEAHLAYLEKAISEIEALIRQKIDSDPDLKKQRDLLDTIPGLGEKTIPVLLSYYGGSPRFEKAKEAAAFAGLDPRQHESGSSVRGKPRLSKVGHGAVRKGHHRRHDAQAGSCRLRRPQVRQILRPGSSWHRECLTGITVSTSGVGWGECNEPQHRIDSHNQNDTVMSGA